MRALYAMFTADRELEAGFSLSLKFQPVKRRGLARTAAMISPEDRERLMCRWRGIEAAAVCEVYNLIRVPHGRPQNTECSSRGRDRPLLRPHIAALIIRLYRITLAYHRREYETRRVRIDTFSLSLCQNRRKEDFFDPGEGFHPRSLLIRFLVPLFFARKTRADTFSNEEKDFSDRFRFDSEEEMYGESKKYFF